MAKRNIMRAFKINEISAVDRPAQQGAVATIMKRAEAPPVEKRAALTTATDGHSHTVLLDGYGSVNTSGSTGYTDGHEHPWVMREDGTIEIGEARGHTHGIAVIGKAVGEIPDGGTLVVPSGEQASAPQVGKQEDTKMTDAEKAALQAQLDKSNAIIALPADQRVFYDALPDDAAKAAYLAKSATARSDDIAKAAEANAVVYKSDSGVEYRKSDDPRLVQMARDRDADRAALIKAEKRAADAELRKRAEDLKHIPGDVDTRMEMLKAIDAIPNEDARKRAIEALKAQDRALSAAFATVGYSNGGRGGLADAEPGSAEHELEKMARERVTKSAGGMSYEQAYAAVLETSEGAQLYAQLMQN